MKEKLLIAFQVVGLAITGWLVLPQSSYALIEAGCSNCCNSTGDCTQDPNIGCNMGYTCRDGTCSGSYVCTQR